MEKERLEQLTKDVEELAKGYENGTLKESISREVARTALEAIKEIAETALGSQ